MNSQGLKMKQQQKLTPSQLMVVRMLQMPATVLEQAIKEEMERNPLLEENNGAEQSEENTGDEYNESADEVGDGVDDDKSMDVEDIFDDDDDYNYREHQESDPNQEDHQVIIAGETTFLDYLQNQLNMKELSPLQRTLAEELIGNIDDAGYLSRNVQLIQNDMAFRRGMEVSAQQVQDALAVIQTLDPPGVGARTLQECLSLQLHRRKESSLPRKVAIAIVDNYFDDFSMHRFSKIIEKLEIDETTFDDAWAYIKTLNPKPGSAYSESAAGGVQYVSPDFVVTRNGSELSFTLTHANTPELHVSQYYTGMLKRMSQQSHPNREDKETLRFLKEKSDSASMFISAVAQRQETLTRTMEAILHYQYDYFLSGDINSLRPMRLKDIAAITGQDISTVSRVVTQKYVQTEFGTFLLKETFSGSFANGESPDVSIGVIRQNILEAVDNEDKSNPLSDEQLVALLKTKGYPMARRTMAKYRDQLNIPVARLRKKI